MPTENRSSNTVMVNVPQSLIERLEKFGEGSTQARTVRMDTLEQLYALCGQPALQPHTEPASYPPCDYCGTVPSYHPWHGSGMINGVENRHIHACDGCRWQLPSYPGQPHPDPIAWMVGTAFWWTKVEAERDAAETGLPIVGLGPMVGPTPVERHLGEPVDVEGATFMGEPNFQHSIEWYRKGISKHWKKICDLRSEVERLRADAGQHKLAMDAACGEIAALRAYLAEAQALLREADEFMYIMTAHDGHAKLAHRYGKDWWDAIDKLRGKVCTALSASAEPSAPKCETCNGTGMVDDGEITCSEGGIPYENGPVKCVKDCPDCTAIYEEKELAAFQKAGWSKHETAAWLGWKSRAALARQL